MKAEQNELLLWNGWIYIQMPTFFLCLEAFITDGYGNRSINTDFVYKGEGCFYDGPPVTRVNLSDDSKEWIKEKFNKRNQ